VPLKLPTFEVDGMKLIKRITLVMRDGAIAKVLLSGGFRRTRNADESHCMAACHMMDTVKKKKKPLDCPVRLHRFTAKEPP